jgi:azurin
MRSVIHYSFLISFFFLSCNSGKKETEKNTESGSDLLKEQHAYDASAVDPKAPVIEIQLQATGNTMDDMKFDKDTLTVKSGSTVKLTLKNGSLDMSMMHNFVLIDSDAVQTIADLGLKAGKEHDFVPDHPSVYVHTKMTMPAEITTITFPSPPAGIYKFICTYPGHYSRMKGWFIVE